MSSRLKPLGAHFCLTSHNTALLFPHSQMNSHHLKSLVEQAKTLPHLLQIQSLYLKTSLDHSPYPISLFISKLCPVSLSHAHSILNHLPIHPSLFTYNTIIREYTNTPQPYEALKIFAKLREIGMKPDKFTYPFVVKACGRCQMVREGKGVHCLVVKEGFGEDHYVGNTLLSMYAACGEIGFARAVFDEMPERDVVSWSSMLAGYVSCGYYLEAVAEFQQMNLANVKPNSVTLVSLLCACTHLGSLITGKSIHSYATINNIPLDVALSTALVEMYSKCGDIENAIQMFNSMSQKNLQTWTIMVCSLANHGRGEDAISLFEQMEKDGLKPDSVSFSAILCACSHLGLVNEGRKYFHRMVKVYKITPKMEHYGCMVDLLGRSGMVEEAYEIIRNMPITPNSVILRSFLSACRNHDKVIQLDKNLTKLLLQVEPTLAANYVLSGNVSAVSGDWPDEAKMRASMKEKGLKKVPGCSWIS